MPPIEECPPSVFQSVTLSSFLSTSRFELHRIKPMSVSLVAVVRRDSPFVTLPFPILQRGGLHRAVSLFSRVPRLKYLFLG